MTMIERRVAIFDPVHRETLQPHMALIIGATCAFELSHEIGDGPYAGQKAWVICRDDPWYGASQASWVPDEDLKPASAALDEEQR